MDELAIERVAADTLFSGVVRVDAGEDVYARAWGAADRRHAIANSVRTRFGIASGVKGLTALTVMRLIERGDLGLRTPTRALLGDDLPLIDDRVTVEHLLGHRSGIGDYLDEDAGGEIDEYVMPVPVHALTSTESYLPIIDGHASKFAPGTEFSYCNGGYVVLAVLCERSTGRAFHDLVQELVVDPAGMDHTAFLRSDELPGDAAVGYLASDGLRTNVLHLPVRGNGDGGVYSTVDDVHAMWSAVFGGRVVSPASLAEMIRPRSTNSSGSQRYGLGFWLHDSNDTVLLEGYDAGVSFRTAHRPSTARTYTVISNTSEGAWPLVRHLDEWIERAVRR